MEGELRDDGALLDAWRAGDTGAGNELLRRHFIAVYRFVSANLSGPGAEPEDVAQRAFEACISARDRARTDFRGYLFGVARRLIYMEWKKRRGDDLLPASAIQLRDVRTSPSAAVARLDEQKLFMKALESLPLEFRSVLERFFWEERSLAEIAEELGIAVGTVKSRLFRGKAMLRERLEHMHAPRAVLISTVARLERSPDELTDPPSDGLPPARAGTSRRDPDTPDEP